jgi:hypothetical protein
MVLIQPKREQIIDFHAGTVSDKTISKDEDIPKY